ncbi:substrate-binding domain-containing protein [Spirillospora sp. NPDC047279]|uniref:substrate-binding domain-containing protein n=1 Tax=Spirillospora sp. NPDC047279 TaxID=3155478 RepID=UPI0033EC5FA3
MSGHDPNDPADDPSRPIFGPANDGSSRWFDGAGRPRIPDESLPERYRPREAPPGYESGAQGDDPYGAPGSGPYRMPGPREEDRRPGPPPPAGDRDVRGGGVYDDRVSASDSWPNRISGPGGSGPYAAGPRRRRPVSVMIGPLAGAVGLAVLLGVGVYAFVGSTDCSGTDAITLDIAAAPDIQPAVVNAAGRFNTAKHEVDGDCVRAVARKADPASLTPLLSGQAPAGGSARIPDVWIPDSSSWIALAAPRDSGTQSGQAAKVQVTKTSVASSPIVVALPRTLAVQLKSQGVTASPSWDNLLKAAGGVEGGAVTKNQMIPKDSVRLLVPDPARNAAGLGALMITNTLLANDPNKESIFAGIVRTARESTRPTVQAQFSQFKPGRKGQQPIALAPEQAVWTFNRTGPAEPAVAIYPLEGTLSQDYPFTITTADAREQKAARLLERAMSSAATRDDVARLGFRSPDGKAPSTFAEGTGVSAQRPRQLPVPTAAQTGQIMQAWSRLSLGIRILTLMDISGTMAEAITPGVTRLQATAQTAQGGLSMMSDDTELGVWVFSTKLRGNVDWRQTVPVGPLGERLGSATRRQLVLSNLSALRPKVTGDTGLFETLMAAYKEMTESYKPEYGNTVLLFTDGVGNDDPGGPSLKKTLATLRATTDPNRRVQVIMIGVGKNVDTRELRQIADAVPGAVYVAETPGQISKIFLQAMARRIQE